MSTGSFDDDDVTHVEGDVNPVRDLEIIHEELRLRDQQYLTKTMVSMATTYCNAFSVATISPAGHIGEDKHTRRKQKGQTRICERIVFLFWREGTLQSDDTLYVL